MSIKERIQELCRKNNISMNKLEGQLGFGKGYISKLGDATPSSAKLQKIADHFNVSLDYIINGEDSDKYSVEDAKFNAAVAKDKQLQRMLQYFVKLEPAKKDMVEQMLKGLSENEESPK